MNINALGAVNYNAAPKNNSLAFLVNSNVRLEKYTHDDSFKKSSISFGKKAENHPFIDFHHRDFCEEDFKGANPEFNKLLDKSDALAKEYKELCKWFVGRPTPEAYAKYAGDKFRHHTVDVLEAKILSKDHTKAFKVLEENASQFPKTIDGWKRNYESLTSRAEEIFPLNIDKAKKTLNISDENFDELISLFRAERHHYEATAFGPSERYNEAVDVFDKAMRNNETSRQKIEQALAHYYLSAEELFATKKETLENYAKIEGLFGKKLKCIEKLVKISI